jgi:hypothetical protein
MTSRLLVLLFKIMLKLYPRGYRLSFASEMLDVFRQSLSDAVQEGMYSLSRFIFHEIRDLPQAAVKEHYYILTNRKTGSPISDASDEKVNSRSEIVLTLVAFAIPLALMMHTNPIASHTSSLPAALVFIGLIVIAGLLNRIPRWCLPYLGLVLSMVSFLVVFNWFADLILPTVPPWLGPGPKEQSTRLLWQALVTGMMWFSLFMVVLFAWLVLGFMRWLRQLKWTGFYEDWSRISFVFYGAAMTALVLLFKDYHSNELFTLVSLLFLAAGAWFYLNSSIPWQRVLSLLAGATLALGVAAAGLWVAAPLQSWSLTGLWNTPETERWFEVWRAVLMWAWLILFLLAPGIPRFLWLWLERSNQSNPKSDEPASC